MPSRVSGDVLATRLNQKQMLLLQKLGYDTEPSEKRPHTTAKGHPCLCVSWSSVAQGFALHRMVQHRGDEGGEGNGYLSNPDRLWNRKIPLPTVHGTTTIERSQLFGQYYQPPSFCRGDNCFPTLPTFPPVLPSRGPVETGVCMGRQT